mmetsp:Transcript_4098/g.16803  ORF Transcript_4098/g.16803 Transcript_4098/m.16803 type:complete len:288 (-) Transcript_4098:199-1062(-)
MRHRFLKRERGRVAFRGFDSLVIAGSVGSPPAFLLGCARPPRRLSCGLINNTRAKTCTRRRSQVRGDVPERLDLEPLFCAAHHDHDEPLLRVVVGRLLELLPQPIVLHVHDGQNLVEILGERHLIHVVAVLPVELLLHHELHLADAHRRLPLLHQLQILRGEDVHEGAAELERRLRGWLVQLLELAQENVVDGTKELDDVLLLPRRLVLLHHHARRLDHPLRQEAVPRDEVHLLLELLAVLGVQELDHQGVVLGRNRLRIDLLLRHRLLLPGRCRNDRESLDDGHDA